MITHHPSEATLASYAAGTLPQALAIVTATHLGSCSTCRHIMAILEAAGGAMLDDIAPVPLSPATRSSPQAPGASDLLIARADHQPAPAPIPILNAELPAPLNRLKLGRWWPIGIGLRWRPIESGEGAWGGLILAQPGRSFPRHGHDGLELTCVLSGSFVDADGHFIAGDLSEPANDHDQPPLATGSQPCLCIIASEGMRLRGLLGIGQRLLGL